MSTPNKNEASQRMAEGCARGGWGHELRHSINGENESSFRRHAGPPSLRVDQRLTTAQAPALTTRGMTRMLRGW